MIGPFLYACRLVKDGPRCGVKVWLGPIMDPLTGEELDRGERWQAEINGQSVEPHTVIIEIDGQSGLPVVKGERIDEAEYAHLIAVSDWARLPGVDAPESNPRAPIDLGKIRPIF